MLSNKQTSQSLMSELKLVGILTTADETTLSKLKAILNYLAAVTRSSSESPLLHSQIESYLNSVEFIIDYLHRMQDVEILYYAHLLSRITSQVNGVNSTIESAARERELRRERRTTLAAPVHDAVE